MELFGRADLSGTLWGSGSWANATDWTGPSTITPGSINVWADPAFVDAAGGEMQVAADTILLDSGTTLDDVVDGAVTASGLELLEDVSINAATQLGGAAGRCCRPQTAQNSAGEVNNEMGCMYWFDASLRYCLNPSISTNSAS